jgi:type IV pilus assembly protein PilX
MYPTRQHGIALFISLVLLLVLTMTGVSAVQTASLEQHMARNARDRMLAFQSAESALRDAERFVEALASAADVEPIAGFGQAERWQDPMIWMGPPSRVAETAIVGVAAPARYVVEHMTTVVREADPHRLEDPYAVPPPAEIEIFRITARGIGGSGNAAVVLQTTYGRVVN